MSDAPEQRRERLVEVYREASGCLKCPLSETRTKVVFRLVKNPSGAAS